MPIKVIALMIEAVIMYFLVLGAHSLRHRHGPVYFYALLGGITAIMSWVTDAGLAVDVGGIRFVVGSTVFYTSLLLGVFVVYVFDGPRETRTAISTVAGVSILMPLVAAALHLHMNLGGTTTSIAIPQPSLRINTASVATTLLDLVFLGIAWEVLGKPGLRIGLWFRTWLTLLGVMWLDVLLFSTGAFSGTPNYLRIMQGTLVSRFFISLFALPFLYGYLRRQSWRSDISLQNRPVLAILQRVAEMEAELSLAEREIQRRRQAETALRESKALLDATGRLANVGGWHVDLPSREVRWTEQTRRMHEVPPDYEPTLEAAIAFYHPQDQAKLRAALQRAMEQGEPFDSELRFITAQGSHRWVHVLCRPHVVDGETVELLGAFQDITEQKEIEEQLRRRERMAAIGQMASGIAHDFRNRVNAILLYAEMVLDHHSVPAAVTRGLETIIKESRGIAELVQQMLDFSGRSMIELRPLDLAQMVDEAVESLQPQLPDDVQVSVERGPGATVVEADRERILQALDNLVSNALDAMPEGGTLSLTLSRVQVTPDGPSPGLNGRGWLPSDLPDGNWVCLSVSDTGTGMTEEMRQHLFEPFFTTKDIDQGTGLGLPQVYGIVRQHEGMVDVETTLGEGTTVRIYLPAYDDAAPARPRERPLEQTRTTVLLVEQNDALRHAERDLLESLGYRVLTARSGREALTVSQSPRWSGTPSNRIDVIIIPLEMPRMRGTELIERLTKPRPHAKAIAVSERALEEEDVASLREAGFAEVLSKPLEVEALAQVLLRVLNDE